MKDDVKIASSAGHAGVDPRPRSDALESRLLHDCLPRLNLIRCGVIADRTARRESILPAIRQALFCLAAAVLFAGSLSQLRASGFYLGDIQDPVLLGTATAGAAALGENATTVFFNPAGLTRLDGAQATASVTTVLIDIDFENRGSTTAGFIPTGGNEGGNAGAPGQKVLGRLVPSTYLSLPLGRPFGTPIFFGLGVNAPFGLETNYDRASVVRYQATNTRLFTLNLNPTLAARLTHWLSLGAGFDVEYSEVALSNAIDFGLAGFALGIPGFAPGANDGALRLEANDVGYGWNIGVLLEPTSHTRIGLAYRSNIEFQLKGHADFRNVPDPFTGNFFDQSIRSDLNLPAVTSLSVYQQITGNLAVVGDVTYTSWSSFDKIAIDFRNPLTPDSVQFQRYQDVFRYSAGLIYTVPNTPLTLRAGYAYDNTPVRNAQLRTASVPDSDRNLVSLGASYRIASQMDVNFAYTHVFLAGASINDDDGNAHRLRGTYHNSTELFSIGLAYRFGGPPAAIPSENNSYRK